MKSLVLARAGPMSRLTLVTDHFVGACVTLLLEHQFELDCVRVCYASTSHTRSW